MWGIYVITEERKSCFPSVELYLNILRCFPSSLTQISFSLRPTELWSCHTSRQSPKAWSAIIFKPLLLIIVQALFVKMKPTFWRFSTNFSTRICSVKRSTNFEVSVDEKGFTEQPIYIYPVVNHREVLPLVMCPAQIRQSIRSLMHLSLQPRSDVSGKLMMKNISFWWVSCSREINVLCKDQMRLFNWINSFRLVEIVSLNIAWFFFSLCSQFHFNQRRIYAIGSKLKKRRDFDRYDAMTLVKCKCVFNRIFDRTCTQPSCNPNTYLSAHQTQWHMMMMEARE